MVLLFYIGRMVYKNLFRFLFASYLASCILLLYSHPVMAASGNQHPIADIRQSIDQFAKKLFSEKFTVSTKIGKLDPHFRLSKCLQALQIFFPPRAQNMGPTTVGVQCNDKKPWKIFLPVEIKVFGPAVVSKQSLPRGSILSAEDLTIQKREVSTAMHGYFTSTKELQGMEVRYSLSKGQVIGPRSLKPRHLIRRGDIVTVIAETKGLYIQIKGKALMNGYHGQLIRVKNIRSNRVLQGEVVATRTVRVKL